eukprot:11220066-Lingulodinium_polyedra.AAC.1
MRSNRRSAATKARKSHAHALHANSCSPGGRARAICEPLWRRAVDSSATLCTVFETVHNDAVEST